MSSRRKFFLEWLVIGVYIGIVLLLVVAVRLLDLMGVLSYQTSLALLLVLNVVLATGFFYVIKEVFSPQAYRQARVIGLPATAQVLDLVDTGWQHRRSKRLKAFHSSRREYRLYVRVHHPQMSVYEATFFAFLLQADVPQKSAIVNIKIHPQQPRVIILAEPARG
ncbi:MAG: hypothetical protein KF770_05935 [Anaerolineae bacterium]|nr:hypothetical protein [Anaerolineae bacterium]